jgi:hypothetical protein
VIKNCHSKIYKELLEFNNTWACYNPSTWAAEVGGSGVQGQLGLHGKFQASLSYVVRTCSKTKQNGAKPSTITKQFKK